MGYLESGLITEHNGGIRCCPGLLLLLPTQSPVSTDLLFCVIDTMSKFNSELLDQQLAAEAPVAEAGIPVS